MVLPRSARIGKGIAVGLGGVAILLGVILAPALLPSPGFRDEEWHLRRLRSGDIQTRVEAAVNLLEMGSERGWVQMLRVPQPLLEAMMLMDFGPRHPYARLGELDPHTLRRYLDIAFERGELSEAELVRACNLAVPSWREAMKDLGLENPPRELRSMDDLPQFIDAIRRFMEAVASWRP